MRILMTLALVFGACAGTDVDVGNGRVCTKAAYDTCFTEHDCMSGDCRTFPDDGFQACTQACSAELPCPDQDGLPVACDPSGVCKPPMEATCRILVP